MDIETFKEKYCAFCGSQRCTSEGEWLEACPHYQNVLNGVEEKEEEVKKYEHAPVQTLIENYLDSIKQQGYREGYAAAVEKAKNWIKELVLSYVNVKNEYVDNPTELELSEYWENAFNEEIELKD